MDKWSFVANSCQVPNRENQIGKGHINFLRNFISLSSTWVLHFCVLSINGSKKTVLPTIAVSCDAPRYLVKRFYGSPGDETWQHRSWLWSDKIHHLHRFFCHTEMEQLIEIIISAKQLLFRRKLQDSTGNSESLQKQSTEVQRSKGWFNIWLSVSGVRFLRITFQINNFIAPYLILLTRDISFITKLQVTLILLMLP